jgi:NAD-dependent dihydropyrimidine dehydrogenase PreA subunit
MMSTTESLESVFIDIEVAEPSASDVKLAKKLEEVCPVNIYKATDSGVELVRGQLDECVLCGLCLEASPPGAVTIIRKYEQ